MKRTMCLLMVVVFSLLMMTGCESEDNSMQKAIYDEGCRAMESDNWLKAISYFERVSDTFDVEEKISKCHYYYVRTGSMAISEAIEHLNQCTIKDDDVLELLEYCQNLEACNGTYQFEHCTNKKLDFEDDELVVEIRLSGGSPRVKAKIATVGSGVSIRFDEGALDETSGDYMFVAKLMNSSYVNTFYLSPNRAKVYATVYKSKPTITFAR